MTLKQIKIDILNLWKNKTIKFDIIIDRSQESDYHRWSEIKWSKLKILKINVFHCETFRLIKYLFLFTNVLLVFSLNRFKSLNLNRMKIIVKLL